MGGLSVPIPFTATRHAPSGMVCSIDHLASAAGVQLLRAGGSAVDAAIAANAVLAVTSPHLCGMGGDLLALVHDGTGPPAALNAAGRAGSGADPERLRADGHPRMPFRGDVRSVTVPGCVDGWAALHERYGRRGLDEVLAPAIGYAEDGFPASILLAFVRSEVSEVDGAEAWVRSPVAEGQRIRRPGSGQALRAIAAHGRDGFYGGAFGEGLLAVGGGEYVEDDLAPSATWVTPLGGPAWGRTVWTIPPSSQGYLALAGAWVAERLDLPDPDDPAWPHLLAEASRQVGHDRTEVLFDGADGEALVAHDRLAPRLAAIDPERRADLPSPPSNAGDTTVVVAVDERRQGVTLIQSNASGFGAHLAEPTTGTFLHNRGIGFDLRAGHPAEYGPGRRPPHTLSPSLVTSEDGALEAVVATMGGDTQPQVVLQLLARLLHHGAGAGEAISAPRFALDNPQGRGFDLWDDPSAVLIERHAPSTWADGLEVRGHQVRSRDGYGGGFGHAHAITVGPDGLAGASDPRALTDAAAGY